VGLAGALCSCCCCCCLDAASLCMNTRGQTAHQQGGARAMRGDGHQAQLHHEATRFASTCSYCAAPQSPSSQLLPK
jgi:hypothetical protein